MGVPVADDKNRGHLKLDYVVTHVCEAYRHRATRRCLFIPLFGHGSRRALLDVQAAFDRVRAMWRKRCYDLHMTNWPPLRAWRAMTYAMNCPPFGVRTGTKARTCKLDKVCPFCFARTRAEWPFRRLEVVLYGASGPYMVGQQLWEADKGLIPTRGAKQLPLIRPDLKIVWYRRRIESVGNPKLPFSLTTFDEHMAFVREKLGERRMVEFNRFGAEYGTVQLDAYPVPRKDRIVVVRSGVLLVPQALDSEAAVARYISKQPDPKDGPPNKVDAGVLDPSKRGLCEAFTRAIRYPAAAIRCEPHWMALALHALKGFHSVRNPGPDLPMSKVVSKRHKKPNYL